jgi:hypothetical protein
MNGAASTLVYAGVREPVPDQTAEQEKIDRSMRVEQEPVDLVPEARGHRGRQDGTETE